MKHSLGIASVLLGLSVTLALPAGPAAADRDKNRPVTASHTQGRSASDPDGLSNGGADKPGHTGGWTSDRDGNNGCGNDDDREDDNNGWCGRRHDTERAGDFAAVSDAAGSGATVEAAGVTAGRLAAAASDPAAPTTDPMVATTDPATATDPAGDSRAATATVDPGGVEVLGAQEVRDDSDGPASLPRTGAGLLGLVMAGAALAGGGAALRRCTRSG